MDANSVVTASEEQTDVESIPETLTSVESATAPSTGYGSETDFAEESEAGIDDATIDEFLDSQYLHSPPQPPPVQVELVAVEQGSSQGKAKDVQDWVDESTVSSQPEGSVFSPEDILKMAAAVSDVTSRDEFPFVASAWIDEDQIVPSGDFKTNFFRSCADKLPLHLMNTIKVLCTHSSTEAFKEYRSLYENILIQAVLNIAQSLGSNESLTAPISVERIRSRLKRVDIATLTNFRNGEYFSEIHLRFKQRMVSQKQKPLIQAVEDEVNSSISKAFDDKNVEIFSAFDSIARVVERCNERKALSYSPEQVAKYALRLQKATSSVLIHRCLKFLAYVGFPLRRELWSEETDNFNDSITSNAMTLSSQGSNVDECPEVDLPSSQGSLMSTSEDELASLRSNDDPEAEDPALLAFRNSPGFVEFLRARQQSPGDSPQEWTQSTPPLYSNSPLHSLPERERSPIDFNNSFEIRQDMLEDGERGNYSFNSHASGSDTDEGPSPRRRRLE